MPNPGVFVVSGNSSLARSDVGAQYKLRGKLPRAHSDVPLGVVHGGRRSLTQAEISSSAHFGQGVL